MKRMKNYARILAAWLVLIVVTGIWNGGAISSVSATETASKILGSAVKTGKTKVLMQVPNDEIAKGTQQPLIWYGEDFMVWGNSSAGFQLKVISRKTGKVLKENALKGIDIGNVQICNGKAVVTDIADGEVRFLNEELKVASTLQTGVKNCTLYVDSKAEKVYCFTQDDGILSIDIASGKKTTVLKNAKSLYPSNIYQDIVTFSYTDKTTQIAAYGSIDMATGETESLPFEGAFTDVSYNGNIWTASLFDKENTYYIGKSKRPNILQPEDANSFVSMLENERGLLISAYDRTSGAFKLKVYGLDGTFLSACTLPEGTSGLIGETMIWSEADNGYFFTVTGQNGEDMLLFWDMTIPVSGKSLELKPVKSEKPAGSKVSKELYTKAEEISEKFAVEVLIAEQCIDEVIDFSFVKEYEETYISEGLKKLETVLASYPDGFFKQIPHGTYQEVEIHLVGGLTKKELPAAGSGGFTSFVGAVSEQEGKLVMAVDISRPGGIEQTMHHEIMHLIEGKLVFDAWVREEAYFSEEDFHALNPKGFQYLDTYDSVPSSVYSDGYEAWFIDIYSRTYAKEDRARIMEYAMIQADWMFAGSEGRSLKLAYISKAIRDAFDTTGWPAQTVWEKTLANAAPDVEAPDKVYKPEAGSEITYKNGIYKVNSDRASVTFMKPAVDKSVFTIPAVITKENVELKVTAIASKAFYKNSKLKRVQIGKNVTTIGTNAFNSCSSLVKVKGGKAVTDIASKAFFNCSKLQTVSIGSKVQTIGTKAFGKCIALTKVTIPASVKKIGKYAFANCKSIKSIKIESEALTMKTIGAKAFSKTNPAVKVEVPKSKINTYPKILKKRGINAKAKIFYAILE